jgi:uncharacterized protein (DUF1810 family)
VSDLQRFIDAQESTFASAIAELRRGQKTSHWMWFVFPQIAGLGQSAMARWFAIASLDEAKAYLEHSVLGPRLRECVAALNATRGRTAIAIFGDVDAMKLRSCLTLFWRAAPNEALWLDALERYFDGQPDAATDQRLRA